MIDHSTCDHASTPRDRAKCRRARAKGEVLEPGFHPPLYSLGPPPKEKATPRAPGEERNQGTTPRDRDKQCQVCSVERVVAIGKHREHLDLTVAVGERCFYNLDPEKPIKALP